MRKLRKILGVILLLSTFQFTNAQIVQSAYSTSNASGTTNNDSFQLIYSIGETATSSNVARKDDLKLTTGFISGQLIDLKTGLTRDSLALVTLYDSLGGDQWTDQNSWIVAELANWTGVSISTINEDYIRVTAVDLPSNNLAGKVPFAIQHIEELANVDFSNNLINGIPDLSNTDFDSFDVSENMLTFGDLEGNASVQGIIYDNQKALSSDIDTMILAGDSYTMSIMTDGLSNEYQWTKNGNSINNANENVLNIEQFDESDAGLYQLLVTNAAVPGLTLVSGTFDVALKTPVSGLPNKLKDISIGPNPVKDV